MNQNDKNEFGGMMAVFAEAFADKPSANRLDVYFEVLSEYSLEEVRIAGKKLLKSCQFFPKIAEFVNVIEGDTESKASNAWYAYEKALHKPGPYKTLDLGDPVAHQVIKDMNLWGYGIENNGYPDSRKDYDFIRQEFMRRYRAVSKTKTELPLTLPGIYELENANKFAAGEDRSWTEGQKNLANSYAEERKELERAKQTAVKRK